MEFPEKSVEELGEWLLAEKFPKNTVSVFKGTFTLKCFTGVVQYNYFNSNAS